jgi:PAS domain S-box-containing protein
MVDDLGSQTDVVPAEGQRSRVLIVDDNADMREHLIRLLAKWWDVEAASDGLAALEAARQNIPDLVLADVMMPRLDGIGLLTALRSDPKLSDILVILLSARAGEEARIEGLNVGADDYLVKPFSARELVARVRSHLSMSRRLRESEARLQAAVDLVKLGRYAWNPQTNELQWDDTLRAMWGLPAGAPVDYDVWRSCVHPDDLARVDAAVQQCADPRGDGVYDIEYRVIGKIDGAERWIATRGRTNFRNDVPVSFYGVALDVTDHKRIEKALERRVEARTRELAEANGQLRSQIEQREIAEAEVQQLQRLDAIGQITSGVAHDFNNLLSVVLTNARLLSRNLRNISDQEGAELIRTAAERGVNLTKQLLAFSRKQRLEPQEVDLNAKIVGMNDLLRATLRGTIQLRTVPATNLWPALVDPTQLEFVILNLAINARDAMPSGGVLTLETFNAVMDTVALSPAGPRQGSYVGVSVHDTGVGIPDDVLPRVFEPFFTTKEPGRGSGLGLAQVFGFAKQSGGGVEIKSRVGEGTLVKVFLPRADRLPSDRELADVDQGSKPEEARLTILVVDDDRTVLRSTGRMLDSLGYLAVPTASGREALRLLESEPKVDLVLADFAMPEMTGVELAKTIHSTHPALPVILITGYGNREELKDLGEARILQKPYTEGELMGKITEALN